MVVRTQTRVDPPVRRGGMPAFLAAVLLAAPAAAQSFQDTPSQIPQGSPFNNSFTENVDFADVDLDGDHDVVGADGGDCCNDQSRMWINLGGLQGGTIGFFQDQTATRFPAVLQDSRDADFVDVDADGDQDLFFSNTSQITLQPNRFWVNMGGLQGGELGFFQDQTQSHWINIGVNDGTTTFSSIPPFMALPGGGFIDWSCDGVFGDLDNDGDLDLFNSTYGSSFVGAVPSRIFLNDGSGGFEEFNPSHFQLPAANISNGQPGLWAEGVHQTNTTNTTGAQCDIADTPLGVELGDLDGDFDIDVLHGARNEIPRLFQNRLQENGGPLSFRDVTWAAFSQPAPDDNNNYEQELGDLDNDGDLDIYGLNWSGGFSDIVCRNDGNGGFGSFTQLPGSASDESEGDWFDYNNDGNLDIFVANFSGQDLLYENGGPPDFAFTNVTSSELPLESNISLGCDANDVDLDGDYDLLIANDAGQADRFFKNVGQIADNKAPYLPHLEQAPDRLPSSVPTVVRVQVYDNSSWNIAQFNTGTLEYKVDDGPVNVVPMVYAGGNLFRGEIDGNLAGVISYQAKSTDEHGNTGSSVVKSYESCAGAVLTYCTASQTSIGGCFATLSGTGTPTLSNPRSFAISSSAVPGGNIGIMYFSDNGQAAIPFGSHGGFICATPPVSRSGAKSVGGNSGACNGATSFTLQDLITADPLIVVAGATINAGFWFRDPPNLPDGFGLSNGIQFFVCP